MKINYCPVPATKYEKWPNILYYEPTPLLNELIKQRNKDTAYFKCPAYIEYYKNVYVIKSPIDITFNITQDISADSKYIQIKEYNQEFFDNYIFVRDAKHNSKTLITYNIQYLFYSDEEVDIEVLNAFEHKSDFINNVSVVQGKFDISKWIRPVECAFTVHDDNKEMKIKRGDPLYYVRFNTNKNIKLNKVEYTKEVEDIVESLLQVKNFLFNNSMKTNYELAKNYINSKKKKCPFSFLFRKN